MTNESINIPLLRKAVEWAESEAAKPWELSEWYQGMWVVSPAQFNALFDSQVEKSPECGTCFCIAGYVTNLQEECVVLVPRGDRLVHVDSLGNRLYESGVAMMALGLTDCQADLLFRSGNTIEDVRRIAEDIAGERL